MYNSNTKILVTGGAGFVGTNFINDLLNRGHDADCIAIIDNMEHGTYIPKVHDKITNFHKVDIRNQYVETIIKNFAPDYVYHFAGLVSIYDCHENVYEAVDNNILGSINIMNGCVKANVKRIIFSETSAVYENCEMPTWGGFNENQSDPTTIYSTTKACLALLAESYSRTKGLNYTALRYFNVAGPLQDYERTIPPVFAGFILRIMGKHNPIVFGDYMKARDYVVAFNKQCVALEEMVTDDVCVEMTIYYASRRPDLDESVILDCLQGFVYKNDRQVKKKIIYWGLDRENPRTEIKVYLLNEDKGK